MSDTLDRLAQAYGIEPSYISEAGEHCITSDETKRALLRVLGVAAADEAEIARSLQSAPQRIADDRATAADARCFMPGWLAGGRVWGITCQLYGLRSDRNWGIGDFEDLARLAELAASTGADFIGVNPLHALFLADPSRISPYSPSSRRFLNPLYIALDKTPYAVPADREAAAATRASEFVNYSEVTRLKRRALDEAYRVFKRSEPEAMTRFTEFCAARGAPLVRFALYEALSEDLVGQGYPAGWPGWPEAYRKADADAVRQFGQDNADRIAFHMWLQWLAETQLRHAQERALAAGMRIGLYLDLAVGVAPDGADTWSEPDTVLGQARLGAPPDMLHQGGQDWGLAPLSPTALTARHCEPLKDVLDELMRSAGAVRIDHAMGLKRLYLIPQEIEASNGAYLTYPLGDMLRVLAEVSQARRTIVIGEDLGTVPEGFREVMHEAEIQGYRVFYFEREGDARFRAPADYAHRALACISTHDLPTLRGWWAGSDIDENARVGIASPASAAQAREARANDRCRLLAALNECGLLPPSMEGVLHGTRPCPDDLPETVVVTTHTLLAKSASRMFAVQIEDLAGKLEQANLPGTVDEHPNWRRKLPMTLDEIAATELFRAVTSAVARERPRTP